MSKVSFGHVLLRSSHLCILLRLDHTLHLFSVISGPFKIII